MDTAALLARLTEAGVLVDRSYSPVGGELRALLHRAGAAARPLARQNFNRRLSPTFEFV